MEGDAQHVRLGKELGRQIMRLDLAGGNHGKLTGADHFWQESSSEAEAFMPRFSRTACAAFSSRESQMARRGHAGGNFGKFMPILNAGQGGRL